MPILQAGHGAGAYALAMVATLILAAHLTPRAWWRRLNARALIITGAGTWAGGALLLHFLPALPAQVADTAGPAPVIATAPDLPIKPIAGIAFRVHGDLNLRAGTGIEARRLVVVPGGASVLPTGLRHGDWWQLRATVDGRDYLGWASSLWLRQQDENGGGRSNAGFSGTVALRTNPALPR